MWAPVDSLVVYNVYFRNSKCIYKPIYISYIHIQFTTTFSQLIELVWYLTHNSNIYKTHVKLYIWNSYLRGYE